jgi:hypothetical protein
MRDAKYQEDAFEKKIRVLIRSSNSAAGIVTGYGLEDRGVGVRVLVGSRIFSSAHRPDLAWGPSDLLLNGYRGAFLWG